LSLQRKILVALAIVIIVIASVAVWQLAPKPASPEARNIKVGLVAPLSTSIGQDMQKAAQMAVNEINDAGGIHISGWNTNVNITLIMADTKTDGVPADAVTAVTQAVESDQVDILIGGYGSAATLADEVVAIENKVPFIITGASNQLVTRRGPQGNYGGLSSTDANAITDAEGMSYMFHYCTTTYDYSKTVVDFLAQEMKPMVAPDRNLSLALFYRDDSFGNAVAQATKYWIQNESLPISLVADRKHPTTEKSFQTDLTIIKEAKPDAVYVADNPDITPLVIQQGWNDVGLKTIYIAVENNQDPIFYSLLGSTGDGQLMESKMDPFQVPSYSSAVQTYSQKFNETYGVAPGMMGVDTYDAFYIAKDAFARAGTIDKAAVRKAIEDTNLPQKLIMTQSGRITFSTGVNYHEIGPVTFMEQLKWNTATSKLESQIVWPATMAGISNFKQADFRLPTGYQAGS
jgi:branched-chain amino acid transport system substrate-binding protein